MIIHFITIKSKSIQNHSVLQKEVQRYLQYFSSYPHSAFSIFYRKGRNDVISSYPHQRDRQNLGNDNSRSIHYADILLLWMILHFWFSTTYQKLFLWPYLSFKSRNPYLPLKSPFTVKEPIYQWKEPSDH